MKYFLSLILFVSCLFSDDFDLNIEFDYQEKVVKQKTFISTIEYKKEFDNFILYTKLEALKDYENNERKYLKGLEIYLKYNFDDYDILIGKDIKYWGSLELYNLTDIYNKKILKIIYLIKIKS